MKKLAVRLLSSGRAVLLLRADLRRAYALRV
jgi:hypothetical protein